MEDKLLLELLQTHYEKARDRFSEGKHTHEDLTIIILKHQTNHIAHLDAGLRGAIATLDKRVGDLDRKIDTSISKLDKDLRSDLHSVIRHQTMVFLGTMAVLTAIVIAVIKLPV